MSVFVRGTAVPPPTSQPTREYWFPLPADIVLFSYEQKSFLSRLVMKTTRSYWSHTGMICSGLPGGIQIRGRPHYVAQPNDDDAGGWQTITGERLFLFESVANDEKTMWDYLTGQMRGGIRLIDARRRMWKRCREDGGRALYRRVTGPGAQSLLQDALMVVQKKYAGCGYNYNPLLLLDAIGPGAGDVRRSDEQEEVLEARKKAFCSQLVAEVLMEAGLLPKGERAPRTFLPVDFLEGGGKEAIITGPAHLELALAEKTGTHVVP